MDARAFLKLCLDKLAQDKGTDLYLKVDSPPHYRASNQLKPIPGVKPLLEGEMTELAQYIMKPHHQERLERERSVDFSFAADGHGRLRANLFYQQGELSCVIRMAWKEIPSFEELRIPEIMKKWALAERGLILIAGAASSGKSTTANAMINLINTNMEKHIITIEDPIEFVHMEKRSLINQREVGQDAPSFASALYYATRQAPDVIFIGEIRDAETFSSALAASEIGRLVISSIHARSVAHVFERVLSFFPPDQKARVLVDISYNVSVIASQRLVSRANGKGYVPVFEILTMTAIVSDMIRQQKLDKLSQVMRGGAADGMQSLNQALLKLKGDGLITELEMYRASDKPQELAMSAKGIAFEKQDAKHIIGDY